MALSETSVFVPAKVYSTKQLREMYDCSRTAFKKMLNTVPNLNLAKNQKILTPTQVRAIFEHLGIPD